MQRRPPFVASPSIDDLETKLGMDLFHNFPDDIELQFEAESPATPATLSYWPGL